MTCGLLSVFSMSTLIAIHLNIIMIDEYKMLIGYCDNQGNAEVLNMNEQGEVMKPKYLDGENCYEEAIAEISHKFVRKNSCRVFLYLVTAQISSLFLTIVAFITLFDKL